MALINTNNLKTLVAIGIVQRKKFVCQATGFLVGFIAKNSKEPEKKTYHVFLVTNRHVFQGKQKVWLRLNDNKDKAKIFEQELTFPTGESRWLAHKNGNVDLALLNINPQALQDNSIDFSIFNEEMFAFYRNFKKIGIEMGDDVYILGFPMGVAGDIQNYPYAKSGIISRVDKEIFAKHKAYLIDSSIFPGNSGSPVVLKPTAISINQTQAVSQIFLMGVISRYLPYKEELYSHQTNPPSVVSLERENSGLSFVVPMDFAKSVFITWVKQKKKLEKAQSKQGESTGKVEETVQNTE